MTGENLKRNLSPGENREDKGGKRRLGTGRPYGGGRTGKKLARDLATSHPVASQQRKSVQKKRPEKGSELEKTVSGGREAAWLGENGGAGVAKFPAIGLSKKTRMVWDQNTINQQHEEEREKIKK